MLVPSELARELLDKWNVSCQIPLQDSDELLGQCVLRIVLQLRS